MFLSIVLLVQSKHLDCPFKVLGFPLDPCLCGSFQTGVRWMWAGNVSGPPKPFSSLISSTWKESGWPSCCSTPSRLRTSTSGLLPALSLSLCDKHQPLHDVTSPLSSPEQSGLVQAHRSVGRDHHVPRPSIQTGERDQAALPGESSEWRHRETISKNLMFVY